MQLGKYFIASIMVFVASAPKVAYSAPSAAKPQITVVDMVPASLSGEVGDDSEPFLAVQIADPRIMVGSAFTASPSGPGNAPVYISQDSGTTWVLSPIVPMVPLRGETCDQTYAMAVGSNAPRGDLYSGELGCEQSTHVITLDEATTSDVVSASTMTVQNSRQNVDQPFTQGLTLSNGQHIYVGLNDYNFRPQTATVDVSTDGGATFTSVPIEKRRTSDQDGPSVRPAVASDGTVYAAFLGWRKFVPTGAETGTVTADVVVVRDDAGGMGCSAFEALSDPSDGLAGRIVAKGITIPWSNRPTLGPERIGSTLSLAVDPNNSSSVYVGWGDRVGNGDIYTLHVRHSSDRGMTWSAKDLPSMTLVNATNIALAVGKNGVLGVLYQALANQTGGPQRWVTHLKQVSSSVLTDTVLATVPANRPPAGPLPYLGDYDSLLAVGDEFRGIFSANNTPDMSDFPEGVKFQRAADFSKKTLSDGNGHTVGVSIDPFYFSVSLL
jgi:hypothetical protein